MLQRAVAVIAAGRPSTPPPQRTAPLPAAERDAAVKEAFLEHAERQLAEAAATRERLEADGAIAQTALAELHDEIAQLHRQYAELRAAYDEQRAQRAGVRARVGRAVRRGR